MVKFEFNHSVEGTVEAWGGTKKDEAKLDKISDEIFDTIRKGTTNSKLVEIVSNLSEFVEMTGHGLTIPELVYISMVVGTYKFMHDYDNK